MVRDANHVRTGRKTVREPVRTLVNTLCMRRARGEPLAQLVHLVFLLGRCAKALPAAVLLALLVLPSRRTLDAAVAALALVCLEFFNFTPQKQIG